MTSICSNTKRSSLKENKNKADNLQIIGFFLLDISVKKGYN